jgi:hyperosmotically inducible protein
MPGRISKKAGIFAAALAVLFAAACAQTDVGLTAKVKTKLAADSTVKASQINVDTKDKVVTLSGTVDNEEARTQAVALARGTEGVRDVVDNLTVKTAEAAPAPGTSVGQAIDDASITAAVKSKLVADSTVGGLKIDVDTKDGVVTLSGPVKSRTEKDTALRIARETTGVRNVQDNLNITG